MATTLKAKAATLTSTLTTNIYTVPGSTTARIEHVIISNGSTAGAVTLSFYDSSATTSYQLINAVAISANGVLELANIILETGDEIRAGAATTTDAKIYLGIVENT